MKKQTVRFIKTLPIFFAAIGFVSCEVETKEGELPEVEVEGEVKLPEVEVDAPEVDVDTKEIEVPDTIEVPTIEVTPADEDEDPDPE